MVKGSKQPIVDRDKQSSQLPRLSLDLLLSLASSVRTVLYTSFSHLAQRSHAPLEMDGWMV